MFENRDELNTNWYDSSFYDNKNGYNEGGLLINYFLILILFVI